MDTDLVQSAAEKAAEVAQKRKRENRGKPGFYSDGTSKPPANDGRTPGYFQSSTPQVNTPYSTTPAAKKRYEAQAKKDKQNVPLWNALPRTKRS